VLLLAALVYGKTVAETPALAAYFDFRGETLALIIIGYGFVASVLPVWLLLAPRGGRRFGFPRFSPIMAGKSTPLLARYCSVATESLRVFFNRRLYCSISA
jgi:carbon starvation CstA-like protein